MIHELTEIEKTIVNYYLQSISETMFNKCLNKRKVKEICATMNVCDEFYISLEDTIDTNKTIFQSMGGDDISFGTLTDILECLLHEYICINCNRFYNDKKYCTNCYINNSFKYFKTEKHR